MKEITGEAVTLGDHVDTDAIIPAHYCTSIDRQFLGSHLLEGSKLSWDVKPGLILVAGRNFGCGSAREHAAMALQGAGIQAVIAHSFARTFFRNAINIALPVLELKEAAEIQNGDSLKLRPEEGVILNLTNGKEYRSEPYAQVVRQIMEAGGLIEFAKKKLALKNQARS